MIDWPDWMPCALMAPYSYRRVDITNRTQVDSGKVRMRRVFQDGPALASLQWLMDRGQMVWFEYFYLNTLQGGSLPFNHKLNVGMTIEPHEIRFLAPYEVSLEKKNLFRVTASVEIRQITIADAGFISILEAYEGDVDSYYEFIDLLDTYVNVDLPASEMGA